MKRKLFTLTTLFALITCMWGCRISTQTQKSLYDQGLDIISLMTELAGNDDYIRLSTGNSSINEIVKEISRGDYTSPKAVYKITLSEDSIELLLSSGGDNLTDSFSDSLSNYIRSRMDSVIISQINAGSGAETLAAVSLCTAGKTFVNNHLTENIIYLYTYESAHPAAVIFTPGEDGSVYAAGNFILNDALSTDSEADIQSFFQNYFADVETVNE